jgi:hypothetical protein
VDAPGVKKQLEDRNARVAQAIAEVAQTPAGQIMFAALAEQCFFYKSTIAGNFQTGEINVYGTLFQEAQRRVYLDIRRHIPKDVRKRIEN